MYLILVMFLQQHPRQNDLKDLRNLQECVQFIHHWKEQVNQVCKVGKKKKCKSQWLSGDITH